MKSTTCFTLGAFALAAALSACSTTANVTKPASDSRSSVSPDARRVLDDGYRETLDRLYTSTPGSRELVAKARGVLVFPHEVSAGLVVGASYGEGELRVHNVVDGYYRTTSASVGWQIGAQSRALVFLFMTDDALNRFRNSEGWAGGVDASVAVLKVGANGALDANAAGAPMLAFAMTNAGLMANLTLEGTKVTRME
jgi:lipid-binding SYLF domain-containing protein